MHRLRAAALAERHQVCRTNDQLRVRRVGLRVKQAQPLERVELESLALCPQRGVLLLLA